MKKIVIYIVGAFTGAALAISGQTLANSMGKTFPVEEIQTFAEVYGRIKANYYHPTEDSELMKDAISGMVTGLDPHSEYMTSEEFQDLRESTTGAFGGLGMEISKKDDFIVVVAPIEDTPAFRAGMQSGDYIIKIAGESTRGMSTTAAVKKMRGEPGTKVTITVTRKGLMEPLEITLERAIIKVKSVRAKILEPGFAYVRLTQFQERTLVDMLDNLARLRRENKAPFKGLIIDLRNNPGGLLGQAITVSSLFLQDDVTVVSTRGRDGRDEVSYHQVNPLLYLSAKDKKAWVNLPDEIKNIPVTVLINSGSASASEIVAGALQDHRRAVVVGVQSFGKGSVQTVMPLSNGGGLKLTTALYFTPNDRSIQAQGIVPDVEFKNEEDLFAFREADLSGHLDNPLGGKEVKGGLLQQQDADDGQVLKIIKEKEAKKSEDELFAERLARRDGDPEKDPQLKKALELVKDPKAWQAALGQAAIKSAEDAQKTDAKASQDQPE